MEATQMYAVRLRDMLDLECDYQHAKLDSVRPDLDVQDHAGVAQALQEFIDIIDQAEQDLVVRGY